MNSTDIRAALLKYLMTRVEPCPQEWLDSPSSPTAGGHGRKVEFSSGCLPCSEWEILISAWKKALKWTDGLDRALSAMLSSVISTRSVGDQLWIKTISPPSTGKSVLCEALSQNKKYILAKSTIRGFHSGYLVDKEGSKDTSLVAEANNKTLIIKDGDTLLQAPNLPQILSEARDIYDRVSRTHYRHGKGRDYDWLNMTLILCGTESLRSLDDSELGERFLTCRIMEEIDQDLEDEIGWRVANRADREITLESNGKPETREGPEMIRAKQLTGGYVDYLCCSAQHLLSGVKSTPEALRECQRLATFVSFLRARPSSRQEESAQREMSSRLISQMVRLAKCLAAVMNRDSLDGEVMRRVRQVALDTARGRTLEIVKYLHHFGAEGLSVYSLAIRTGEGETKCLGLLRFLRQIRAVELFDYQTVQGLKARPRWRLTERVSKLYQEVVGES